MTAAIFSRRPKPASRPRGACGPPAPTTRTSPRIDFDALHASRRVARADHAASRRPSSAPSAASTSGNRPNTAEPDPGHGGGERAARQQVLAQARAGRLELLGDGAEVVGHEGRERVQRRHRRQALRHGAVRLEGVVHVARRERSAGVREHERARRQPRPGLEDLPAPARDRDRRARGRTARRSRSPPRWRAAPSSSTGRGSRPLAAVSAAPASLEPPPRPAPAGMRLSMRTRKPPLCPAASQSRASARVTSVSPPARPGQRTSVCAAGATISTSARSTRAISVSTWW